MAPLQAASSAGSSAESRQRARRALCAFLSVLTKHSTSIQKPQNRPIWHGKTSPPSQEMLCFPSIRRFIHICSVFQTLGWCSMSSSFSAPAWNLPWQTHLSEQTSAELGWSLVPHYSCPTREFALEQGALSLLHHLSPCQACVGQGFQTCDG